MPFIILSAALIFASYPTIGTMMAVWVLAASQLSLLIWQIRKRQVSGVGGFLFMSFLFFAVRPIYIIVENDYRLVRELFKIRMDLTDAGDAMWWASLGSLCFALGAHVAPSINRVWIGRRRRKAALNQAQALVSRKVCYGMMLFQLMTLPIMYVLAQRGRNVYGSGAGAYLYDLPVPLQAVHIVTVVVLLERYLRTKTYGSLFMLIFSSAIFVEFTWLMREVSMFRGFYIAGVMIAGIAILQRIKGRVGFIWLIIPIVAVQPFFQYMGQDRYKKNTEMAEEGIVDKVFRDQTIAQAYWQFYDSGGDMNIFDTFVAAQKSQPKFYPYVWSWIYAPLHIIPRGVWPEKPRKGITQDLSFMGKAPYCPGILGFFLLDGGLAWMLGSMLLLGFLVCSLDCWVFTLPRGYLQYCLIGIVAVNAMFLTRFFLWQYFYQMLYAMVPCMLMAAWFGGKKPPLRANQHPPNFSQRPPVRGLRPSEEGQRAPLR